MSSPTSMCLKPLSKRRAFASVSPQAQTLFKETYLKR
uniref:Uncharacterized protein n=1 Tax=Anguilla anguilla TaxID=7936 RepID=A0A0E9VMV1_ANGAN